MTFGDKFDLENKNEAVYHYSGYGPTFGKGFDLLIQNHANTNHFSYASVNYTYKNERYKNNDKQSWKRFCGNKNTNEFKVN